ncbi:MAG: PQ-loop domain-containing transporter, partial [Myxococcota bacterium]
MIEMTLWDVVGGLGMACIEASYATQIMRLHKRKEADDISLFFPGLNLLGRILAMVASYNLGASVFVVGFFAGV